MAGKPKKGSGDSVVATMLMREHVERAKLGVVLQPETSTSVT